MCPDGLTECRPAAKLRTAVLTNDALENRCVGYSRAIGKKIILQFIRAITNMKYRYCTVLYRVPYLLFDFVEMFAKVALSDQNLARICFHISLYFILIHDAASERRKRFQNFA